MLLNWPAPFPVCPQVRILAPPGANWTIRWLRVSATYIIALGATATSRGPDRTPVPPTLSRNAAGREGALVVATCVGAWPAAGARVEKYFEFGTRSRRTRK